MINSVGPLYEANFVIADEVLADVDIWLAGIVRTALRMDGIDGARAFESGTDGSGHTIRTCQFQMRDDDALDEHLDGFIAELDAEAAEQYGDSVIVHSRALRMDHSHELPHNENPVCLNCGTRLRGQYCGHCGQRSLSRLISIWQLMREAFGDLLEFDSRIWRTLIPLLIRPGKLTRDYLEGRRARYMPPFRTYLVLSVIFFVVAFFNPKEDLSLFFDPEPEPTPEEVAEAEKAASVEAAEQQEQLDKAPETLKELEADGKIDDEVVVGFSDAKSDFGISFDSDDNEDSENDLFSNCENASFGEEEDLPEWVKKRFSDDRLQEICEKNQARGIKSFAAAVVDNVPVALIVLIPLMAMVLKVLYPLSRRYFVEHLLFFVHFHAFFFLILTLQLIFERLMSKLSLDGTISTLIIVATSFYIPVYLYKAMRRVYGQGHLITIFKFLVLLIAYITGATITLLGAFLVALVSA